MLLVPVASSVGLVIGSAGVGSVAAGAVSVVSVGTAAVSLVAGTGGGEPVAALVSLRFLMALLGLRIRLAKPFVLDSGSEASASDSPFFSFLPRPKKEDFLRPSLGDSAAAVVVAGAGVRGSTLAVSMILSSTVAAGSVEVVDGTSVAGVSVVRGLSAAAVG